MPINNLDLKKGYSIKINNKQNHIKTFLIKDSNHICEFPQKSIHSIFQTFTKSVKLQVSVDLMRFTLYINQKLFKPISDVQDESHFMRFTRTLTEHKINNPNLIKFFENFFHQGGLFGGWIMFFMQNLAEKNPPIYFTQKESIHMLDFVDANTFLYTCFFSGGIYDLEKERHVNSNDFAVVFQCKVKIISSDKIDIIYSKIGLANYNYIYSNDRKLLEELKYSIFNTPKILFESPKNSLKIDEGPIWRKYLGTKAF